MSKKFLSDVLIECGLQVDGTTTLGTATATTVATSDNSTNIATTAWVKALGYSTTDSFISDVTFNGASLSFTGTNSAFTGSLDLSALQTQLTDIETVYATVRNVSGGLILKGTPLAVVIGQTAGNLSDVIPADASDPALMPALFIADEDIAEEAEGRAVAYGEIAGIDTSLYPSGTTVYVAPGGGWTDIKPTGTDLIQNLGVVTKQHNTNGGGIVTGVGRSNDVPNIPQGYAWVGNANGVATPTQLGSLAYSSATYDNYVSWNLKTNSVQRTTVQSGGTLDIIAGNDISISYGAGGKVTIASTATGSIDYIETVALNGNSLEFTSVGNAFAGSIDLSSLVIANNYVTALSFNTSTGVLTATRQGLTDLTVDLDGRYLTSETLTELSIANNILSYRDETGAVTEIDLALYLDDTNLARITSGSLDAQGVATFTRDDSSTFTVDFSSLISASTDTLADVTGRGATTSNTIEFTGAANTYVGIQGETDINLKIGTGAGSEPRMYLFGSANGQSNAGNVFIGTANNTGVVDINGDVDISGDVGIGTSTPQDKLDVNGIVNSSRSIVSNSVYTIFTGRSNRTINDYGGLNKQYFKLNLVTPGPNTTGEASAHGFADLRFQLANNAGSTSVADIMTLRAGGNVGIGNTTPSQKLDVTGHMVIGTSGGGYKYFIKRPSDSNTSAYFGYHSADNGDFGISNSSGGGNIRFESNNGSLRFRNTSNAATLFNVDNAGNTIIAGALRVSSLSEGILISDANGNVSIDTSTYLTSYTETDTLASVTGRGSTTTNSIQVGGFLAASTVDTNSTTKAEMLTNAVAKFKPHVLNSGSLAIAQVDNGNSVGLQFTNGAGTADWDIALQPFGGNVGIGKVNPAGALHVYSGTSERFLIDGDVKVMGSTDFNITGANRRFSFTNGSGTIRTTTANKLFLETNSTTAITIDANQNVGIGDTNPTSSKLSVVGTVGVTGAYGSQSPDLNQGSAGWHKLGTLITAQGGRNLKLEFNAGQGYNANYGQHSILHIVFRTSNGASQNNGIYASCHWYTEGFVSLVNEVRVRQIDTLTYEFYVSANAFTGLSFVKAETSLYDEWINDFQRDIEEPVVLENEVFSAYELYAIHSNIRGFHALHTDGILSTDADLGVGTQTPTFTSGSGIEVQRTGTATLRLDSGSMATELRAYTDGTFLGQLSSSYLDLGTNNTTRVRITSGGNVGIGTTSPTKLLTVGSGATASGISNNGIYVAVDGGAAVTARNTTNEVEIQLNAEVSQGTLGTFTNHPLAFRVNNSNKMWIDTSGNVGIGTTSPQAKVHSKGEIRVDYNNTDGSTYITGYGVEFERGTNYLRPRAADGTQTLHFGSAGDDLDWNNINFKTSSHSQFRVAGSDIMRINSTGVGIGTTNPTEELHVEGEVKIQPKHTTGTPPSLYLGDLNNQYQSGMSSSGHLTFRSSSNMYFQSGGANYRMTIDGPTGNVYIGGTTTASEKLEVDGNIKSSGYLIIGGDDAARIALGTGTGNPVPQTIASFGSAVHIGAFVDFTIYNETKEHMRSGTLQLVFNANEVRFNEASTMDIGDTSACLLTAVNNAGVVSVLFETPDPTFHIKYQTRTI